MSDTNLADIYARAADWLETHDWCQGDLLRDANGRGVRTDERERATAACIVGALYMVTDGMTASEAWHNLTVFMFANSDANPPSFNDDPECTKAEVISKLREAAKAVR